MQMNELADIARCVANTPLDDERSLPYLLTCLEDLRFVIDRRKLDALTVETFGARIEKLIRWVSVLNFRAEMMVMLSTLELLTLESSYINPT